MDPVILWITPAGQAPYELNLTAFFNGARRENVRPQVRERWAGDFTGRPRFATELATYFRFRRPGKQRAGTILHGFREFFRFLSEVDPAGSIGSSSDLQDVHGEHFLGWLEDHNVNAYKTVKNVIRVFREIRHESVLFWPQPLCRVSKSVPDLDIAGIQKLFAALRSEGRAIKQMFLEGERLASMGSDPRGIFRQPYSASWGRPENQAWLLQQLTANIVPSRPMFLAENARGLHMRNKVGSELSVGDRPWRATRFRRGIVGKIRWFHPGFYETAVFLWLLLIQTGWNLATVVSMDASTDESWFEPHPQQDGLVVLHSFKARSDRHQLAISSTHQEWHPYQLVRFMIEKTRTLRRTLEQKLVQAQQQFEVDHHRASERAVFQLHAKIKSPWLFHLSKKTGTVSAITSDSGDELNAVLRAIIKQYGLHRDHPRLLDYATGEMRDAWIGHAYTDSGYSVLIATLAAQHKDPRTLRHYLNRRRYGDHSERQVRKVQNAAFSEISERRPVDATRLRILVERSSITEEQASRLSDYRQRTRLGMGCLDPYHPPRDVAPGHPKGELCRIQRCTGCEHGVVFVDSLEHLARAYAELTYIKTQMPYAAWIGSSLAGEERAISQTLEMFDASAVASLVKTWAEKFRSGEVAVHDIYAAY